MTRSKYLREHFNRAIEYVRENKNWSAAENAVAWERIDSMRCDLRHASEKIATAICDLMDEYGADHDLPEGWWFEYGNEDDIFTDIL